MNRIGSYNSQSFKITNKEQQQMNEGQMIQQKHENGYQIKQFPSLKILNQQIQQILQIKHVILTKPQQQMIFKIINHARTNHNIREYINLRYTNKLSYILDKFAMAPQTYAIITEEIQRVKLLVSVMIADTSPFLSMEINFFRM